MKNTKAVGFFRNIILTEKGSEMLLASNKNINNSLEFSICKFGDGKLSPEEIKIAQDIKSPWRTQNINTVRIDKTLGTPKLIIEITFTNKDMTEPKIMSELGIFAKNKDGVDYLFGYSLSNVQEGEEIEIENNYPTSFKITIISLINNDNNIINIIDPDGFLTKEVIELFKESIKNIAFRKIQGILPANTNVIQVPLGAELLPVSKRLTLNIEGEIFFLGRDYSIDSINNTITLNEPLIFNKDTHYEIIDPLPSTYVKEQIAAFIADFEKLVNDSGIEFNKIKDNIYLEFKNKVDEFYSELDSYIQEHQATLKGDTGFSASEDWLDKNQGKTYEDYLLAIKGSRGIGVRDLEFVGSDVNNDSEYALVLEDGTKTEGKFVIPQGIKGDPFYISKIYASKLIMEADFTNEEVDFGEYVIISSEDSDNGKLYEKKTTEYSFIIDMGNKKLTPATSEILGGVKIGEGIDITPEGVISVEPTISMPIGTIIKFPTDELVDPQFKLLNGSALEAAKYPQLVELLQNSYIERQTLPRRDLDNNNDDQLIITLTKSGSFYSSAYQTFGESSNGKDFSFFNSYCGIKFDARNCDYHSEFDPLKHDATYPGQTKIFIKTDADVTGYSVGIFGGEDGLVPLRIALQEFNFAVRDDRTTLGTGEQIFIFFIEDFNIGGLPLFKRTPLTFRLFKTGGDISTNTSPGFTVKDVEIKAIWMETAFRYIYEYGGTLLELPIEKMSTNEKKTKYGYKFHEYMFVGNPYQTSEETMFSYNEDNLLNGEVDLLSAINNNLPDFTSGITMAEPKTIKKGYINKYCAETDSWKLEKTFHNIDGYFYDPEGTLLSILKPSEFHVWNPNTTTWDLSAHLKDKALKELTERYLDLELRKDKATQLNLQTDDIQEEISNIKKEMEAINELDRKKSRS